MRLYKYNVTGIEITDAINDNEPVGIVMENKQILKPEFINNYGLIKKAILFMDKNSSDYRLEVY